MAADESSLNNFGILISYVLPGFTALQGFPLSVYQGWGTSAWSATPFACPSSDPNSTLSFFLSGTVMAFAAGLTVSTLRWLTIDSLHRVTGIKRPERDFARLETNVAAYEFLGLIHYRYYKFYANMVVALIWAYATREYALGWKGLANNVPLIVLFFFASRDSLRKYYERTGSLLGPDAPLIELAG